MILKIKEGLNTRKTISAVVITTLMLTLAGCSGSEMPKQIQNTASSASVGSSGADKDTSGGSSDAEVMEFISMNVRSSARGLSFKWVPFGCSTVSTVDNERNRLFGRSFDWNKCNTMIVHSVLEKGYVSISTVSTDFINMSGLKMSQLPDRSRAVICMYAPLDGLNEKGPAVSVNMIWDSDTISHNTDKPDITAATVIRLLLDKAADADEAVDLLQQYDMHVSRLYDAHSHCRQQRKKRCGGIRQK